MTLSLFGDPAFTVRTPKCRQGYAGQLWADSGHWHLGVFPTADDAKQAVRSFAQADPREPARGTPPAELPAGWHWNRCPGVRTPKRPEGYASQLWGRSGHWELGTWPTIREAHAAGVAFASTGPAEPPHDAPREQLPANWHRRRSDSHAPRYDYVRRVKGNAWQARPWLGNGRGSLNLGLFTFAEHGEFAERAAALVSRAFCREWKGGRTVAEVVALLKQAPKVAERVPAHVGVPPEFASLLPPAPPSVPAPRPRLTPEERRELRLADRRRKSFAGYRLTLFGPWAEVVGGGCAAMAA